MIAILMATYTGEKHLAGQIDSLLAQTFQDFTLYINDDVSTDNTLAIAKQYAEKFPEKIFVTQNKKNSGDAKLNFIDMMAGHTAEYVMLCDQDDFWLPDKIEKTLAVMKKAEKSWPGIPVLVHTDLSVADENLQIIHPSYKKATIRSYDRMALNQVLNMNNVSGCTAMYNAALADLLKRKPKYCAVHDWWLQIVASALGKIAHLDEPTILYRQHGKNAIGAKDVRTFSYKVKTLLRSGHIKGRINSTYPQAESLLETYRDLLSAPQIKLLERFVSIREMGKIGRIRTIFELDLFMNNLSRNIAYFLFV